MSSWEAEPQTFWESYLVIPCCTSKVEKSMLIFFTKYARAAWNDKIRYPKMFEVQLPRKTLLTHHAKQQLCMISGFVYICYISRHANNSLRDFFFVVYFIFLRSKSNLEGIYYIFVKIQSLLKLHTNPCKKKSVLEGILLGSSFGTPFLGDSAPLNGT